VSHFRAIPSHGLKKGFFSILWWSQWWSSIRRISQIWLQVRQESKKKMKNSSIFCWPAEPIVYILQFQKFVSSKSGNFVAWVFHKNPSCGHWIFFGCQVAKICQKLKNPWMDAALCRSHKLWCSELPQRVYKEFTPFTSWGELLVLRKPLPG